LFPGQAPVQDKDFQSPGDDAFQGDLGNGRFLLVKFRIGCCIPDHGFQSLVFLENGLVGSMKRAGRIDLFLKPHNIAADDGQRISHLMGNPSGKELLRFWNNEV